MRKLRSILMAAMIALLALTGTGGLASAAQGGLPAEIVGQTWQLSTYQDATQAATDLSANKITIKFDSDGRVSGFGGCNGYGGQYTAGANQALTISEVISTLIACADDAVTQWESRYFAALQTVSQYRLEGDKLVLVFANGAGALTFGKQPAGTLPADMLAVDWMLISYQDAAQGPTDVSPARITIRFSGDGRVDGFGGCNGFGGQYTVGDNQALTISEIISTLKACEENDLTKWETLYFNALQTVSRYQLDGERLTLTFDNGAGTLVFGKQPAGALPQEMLDRDWHLVSGGNSNQAPADVSSYNITIRFAADGGLSGFGGCNNYSGSYKAGANQALTIGPIASTKRACVEEGRTQWESAYFSALGSVNQYRLIGDQLQLLFDNGQDSLTFIQAANQPQSEPTAVVPVPGMPTTGGGGDTLPWLMGLAALVLAAGLALRLGPGRPAHRQR